MSDRELSRFEVVQRVADRRLTQDQAAQILGLSRRQVYRLLDALRQEGIAGLLSKRRGRPSPHQLALGTTERAVLAQWERSCNLTTYKQYRIV